MAETMTHAEKLKRLLELHALDQEILEMERGIEKCKLELAELDDGVAAIEEDLERLESKLQELHKEARSSERAADDKREALNRVRNRVSNVQNERQYSAASLEFDLIKRDLRTLEDRAFEKLQVIEQIEGERKELRGRLEEARSDAGPRREKLVAEKKELEDRLAIQRDRRQNLAIRVDKRSLALYDRIRSGRSPVALAAVTDEGVCGNCHTFVTVQQQMEIKSMDRVVCCEGCGVILYPRELASK